MHSYAFIFIDGDKLTHETTSSKLLQTWGLSDFKIQWTGPPKCSQETSHKSLGPAVNSKEVAI